MHDIGFTPDRGEKPLTEMRRIVDSSVEHGLQVPAVRATMLAGFFSGGVGIYVFYALQPYLLELWGNPHAYGIAGLVAAISAGAAIVGGLLTERIRGAFRRRTSALLITTSISVLMLVRDRPGRQLLAGGRRDHDLGTWRNLPAGPSGRPTSTA